MKLKKIFALLLCASMLLSVLPMGALAGLLSVGETPAQEESAGGGFLTVDGEAPVQDGNGGFLTVNGQEPGQDGNGGFLTVAGGDEDKDEEPRREPVPGPVTEVFICEWCGWADGYHADNCPSRVDEEEPEAPVEQEEPAAKPDKSQVRAYAPAANTYGDIFEALLAAETLEEFEDILSQLDEAQQAELYDLLDEDELDALAEAEAALAYAAVTEYQPAATQVLTEESRAEAYFSAYALALAALQAENEGEEAEPAETVTNGCFDYAPPFTTAGPLIEYETPDVEEDDEEALYARYSGYSAFENYAFFDVEPYADGDGTDSDGNAGSGSGLVLEKKAKDNSDGSFTITLEAYATGTSVTTVVKDGVDIVLMLDLSKYMGVKKTVTETTATQVEGNTRIVSLTSDRYYYYSENGEYYPVTISLDRATRTYNITYGDGIALKSGLSGNSTLNEAGITLYSNLQETKTESYDTEDESKLRVLKAAVNNFIQSVHDTAPASRIAIVTYADQANVLSGSGEATAAALVTVDDGGLATLNGIVDGLEILGGNSNSHYAAADAVQIFQAVPNDTPEYARQRAAILFSAGIPGDGWADSDKRVLSTGNSIAQATMTQAHILKGNKGTQIDVDFNANVDGGASWSGFSYEDIYEKTNYIGCGATVYCVGLDIPTSGDPRNNDVRLWKAPWKAGALANEYFWRSSSHRLDGTHITSASDLGEQGPTWLSQGVYNTEYTYRNNLYYFYPDGLTRNQTDGYYLTATSTSQTELEKLKDIFDNIAENVVTDSSASTTLDEETVIKDIIADQFTLPAGTNAISVSVHNFAGIVDGEYTFNASESTPVEAPAAEVSEDGTTVSVTGFDFAEHWCGTSTADGTTTNHGCKLVISFTVKPKEGFLGGNNVFTNGEESGVYVNDEADEPIQPFPQPEANVTIKGNDNVVDSNVYLGGYYGQTLTGDQIKAATKITIGGVELDLSQPGENYGLEAWQTEYVDIEVTITDKNGNDFADITQLTDDVEYTVTVTIKPKAEANEDAVGKGNSTEGTPSVLTGTVHVFKPELTYMDSEVWYGGNKPANYDDNLTRTRWVHTAVVGDGTTSQEVAYDDAMAGNIVTPNITMLTESTSQNPPELTTSYTTEAGKIVEGKIETPNDIPVTVTVKIDTWDVTSYVSFVHAKCGDSCVDPVVGGQFWLHVKTCSLTIKKVWASYNEAYYQDAVFTVSSGTNNSIKVVMPKPTSSNGVYSASVTINGLKVGETYTITEDTDWAWRYTPDATSKNVTLVANGNTVTFTNTKSNDKWLDANYRVENKLGADGNVTSNPAPPATRTRKKDED